MHREILAAREGDHVDHRNGDRRDHLRANLWLCTQLQNNRNVPVRPHSSRYKGVQLYRATGRWAASLTFEGRGVHLGYFGTEEEAARAYDAAASARFGEFARLNFPAELATRAD